MEELSMQPEKPSDGEILSVLVDHFDAEPVRVLNWLAAFDPFMALIEHQQALGAATTQEPQ